MGEQRTLGIALYHRLAYRDLTTRAADKLLALLDALGEGTDLRLFVGDEQRSSASAAAIADVSLSDLTTGTDRGLVVADSLTAPTIFAQLYHPQQVQPRAITPARVGIVASAESLDADAFAELCNALDVRYGFVTMASGFGEAWDEVFWPDHAGLRGKSDDRRHTNAWLQMMRSFGRHGVGVGVPDVYWGNVFGFQIINELRRHDGWEHLEQLVSLRYLDSGAVTFTLSEQPAPETDPALTDSVRRVGDVCALIGLMHRALEQARLGDLLLLDQLVATGDQRLLLGLAFAEGLDAFRRLAGPAAADVEKVGDAMAFLDATAHDRPRCYGETWPTAAPELTVKMATAVEAARSPAAPPPSEAAPQAQIAVDVVPAGPEDVSPAPAPRVPDGWAVHWIARGSVRLELATVQWTAQQEDATQQLELGLVNALSRPVNVVALTAVKTVGDTPQGLDRVTLEVGELAPVSGRASATVDVSQPQEGDCLHLAAHIVYELNESVADVVVEAEGVRIVTGGQAGEATVATGWPVEVALVPSGRRLLMRITNTTQEPWRAWGVRLAPDDAGAPIANADGDGVLVPGATSFVALDTAAATPGSALQVWLTASVDVELGLAEFEPRR